MIGDTTYPSKTTFKIVEPTFEHIKSGNVKSFFNIYGVYISKKKLYNLIRAILIKIPLRVVVDFAVKIIFQFHFSNKAVLIDFKI